MKHILLLLISCIASTSIFAQRNCSTMDYLELRKQHDPAMEQRMEDVENIVQEWSKLHPIVNTSPVVFPTLPGFVLTGNEVNDRIAYAGAKQQYLLEHPQVKLKSLTADGYYLRLMKRKSNSFINK